MADIQQQLAAVLGYPIKRIRITDEAPPRFSVNLMPVRGSEKSAAHERMAVSKTRKRDIVGDGISSEFCATTSRGGNAAVRVRVRCARRTQSRRGSPMPLHALMTPSH